MKRIDPNVPKALRDVWAWKEAVYREVKDLPVNEALTAILDRAARNSTRTKSRAHGQSHPKSVPV